MIEFADATKFINDFEAVYSKKIVRIPYSTKEGVRKTILMCKCGKTYISLPYMSLGVIENRTTDRKTAPFMLFETEEGNIISTSKKNWEIRDTAAHSPYIYADKIFTWINITDKDDVMDLYTSNVRRKIRKSLKGGIVVKSGSSKKLIRDFYHAYLLRMKEISVAPFSKQIIKNSVKVGMTTIFVAYKDNKIVGGATLNDMYNGVLANGLFATPFEYNKYYVSYNLHYSMMRFAKEKDAVYYSFGRSTRNSNVHHYKMHYKGEDIPLYWSYSRKKKNIRDMKLLYWLWSKLPDSLTKYLGPIVSRYVY
ncbi:MAG: hypothetical protein IJ681_04305 [Bacteroidales bacterium]|nr:hypothetical protein [Bacteroidales bacterium]